MQKVRIFLPFVERARPSPWMSVVDMQKLRGGLVCRLAIVNLFVGQDATLLCAALFRTPSRERAQLRGGAVFPFFGKAFP